MLATSRAGFDLPYRKGAVAPGGAACFLVEAGSTRDFAVDVKTHPWMERICLHRGLDGSDSFSGLYHSGTRRNPVRLHASKWDAGQLVVEKGLASNQVKF